MIKERNDFKKVFNNIYVKNFPDSWTQEDVRGLFTKYGNIKSLAMMTKKDKEGLEKPFAFVCYDKEGDPSYGPSCATKAVEDLHGKEFEEGLKIYVQPALPA
jgi:polyadenylate-binding protein